MGRKKISEVVVVDSSFSVSVNGIEASLGRVVAFERKVTLKTIELSLERELSFDHLSKSTIDVAGELVETADSGSVSVESGTSEVVVFAGEEHLEEAIKKVELANKIECGKVLRLEVKRLYLLLERESTIIVAVEELDELVELAFEGSVVVLVPQVVEEFDGGDAAIGIAVNSLESGVGSEISDVAEALAETFGSSFTLTNGDEDVLELVFCIVTKRHL